MENIAIPIDLEAFALSPSCCDGPSRIAPITQQNYMGLRLDESLIQHDVLDHVDYHLTSPASANVRLTDLGADPPELRQNRLGVYLHWSIPRLYRTAAQFADSRKPDPSVPVDETDDRAQPVYRKVPDRWLVVRRLSSPTPTGKLPPYQTWVVESNRVRRINDIPDDVDLETDVTPFVSYEGDSHAPDVLDTQAEIFLGQRHQHSGWQNGGSGWSEDTSSSAKFIDLTVMSSGNPMFPDYVPHNGSVFSIVDSFAYKNSPSDQEYQHLTSATADYFVIGWHSNAKDDPLNSGKPDTLANRLAALMLNPDAAISQQSLDSKDPTRVLIHGAIYNVKYNVQTKPFSLADEAAKKFTPDVKMEPLSVGVTPLDAILAFLEAHKNDIEVIFGQGSSNVTKDILQLATLLYAADDNYDSRVRAQDLLYTNNWASEQGGFEFKFDGKAEGGKPPATPTQAQLKALDDLNELQSKFDTISRKIQAKRWVLFSEWWKYVSDRSNVTAAQQGPYRDRVAALKKELVTLQSTADQWKSTIDQNSGVTPGSTATVPCKKVPLPTYFNKKDPTLCIAGLDSGWPADFLQNIAVFLDHQLKAPTPDVNQIFGSASNPVPTDGKLQDTSSKLLQECLSRVGAADPAAFPKGYKQWNNTNPFSPMFIEWEALYYHVDRTKWEVGVRPSPVGHPHSQVRFSVNELLYNDLEVQKDYRVVSGRVLILPQPVFSLQAIAQQVLDDPQANVDKTLAQEVRDNIAKLKFISAPLDGLTQHLLTRYVGTHVAPNVRVQGKKVVPLGDAVTSAQAIEFGEDGMLLIDSESATTPYGNLMSFDPATFTGVPFKGMTHGQLLLTKLNVVDKFGQSICVPTPKPKPRIPIVPPPSMHPCLSDYVTPDIVNGVLNTIYPEPTVAPGQWPLCRFIQLAPSINQGARINTTFLTRNDSTQYPFWHETNDDLPESPLFGWIIVNYQDYGLQFFLADGTFYREVRVGGPSGTNASSKWLPFDPPKDKNTGNKQLDELINKLNDPSDPEAKYLTGLFGVIDGAIKTMPYPPSDYAAFANSIVGKPLALVNVGWSLELSQPALEAQNTLGNLPSDVAGEMASYKFPLKIGDVDRPFDGVVGYFKTDNTENGQTDWSKLYTYFTSPVTDQIVGIEPSNFPVLSPKYIDANAPYPVAGVRDSKPYSSYTEARTAQYTITTMIIDPYTAVHAYSPILPISSLKLPLWTIQKAFSRMTGFFHLGPTLLTKDVPTAYDKTRPLNADSWLNDQNVSNPPSTDIDATGTPLPPPPPDQPPTATGPAPDPTVRLPISGKKGLWQWLQPYDIESDNAGEPRVTRFNALGVEQEDTRIRKDPAPYTFVEGYLQLARPLLNADVSGAVGGPPLP